MNITKRVNVVAMRLGRISNEWVTSGNLSKMRVIRKFASRAADGNARQRKNARCGNDSGIESEDRFLWERPTRIP